MTDVKVFSGHVPTLAKDLLLDKPKDYWFISQAELQIDGVNDKVSGLEFS